MDLNQAIAADAKVQCLQIGLQMDKKGQTFQEAMTEILTTKKAPNLVIQKFSRDTNKMQIPFKEILDAIKERESKAWMKRKIGQRQSEIDRVSSRNSSHSPGRSPALKASTSSKGKLSFVMNKTPEKDMLSGYDVKDHKFANRSSTRSPTKSPSARHHLDSSVN